MRGTVMRATVLAIATVVSAGSGHALAQQTPIDVQRARAYFEELEQLGSADGGRLWGRPVNGPLLFADRQTRTVVANMPDSAGRLQQRDGVWIGTLSDDQNIANTSLTWSGRTWAMVVWPVSDNRYTRGRLLMHESFHRLQPVLGLVTQDRANAHMATLDGRIYTRLEWRALTEALLRTGAERQQALRDALTFRARRRSSGPSAAEDERQLELNEGLAEYTGLVLSGLPRDALHDRAAVQLAQYEQQENFARSFAYASGPAYALLLDAAGVPWRSGLTAASDVADLAAAAYGIAAVNARDADSLIARYRGERMVADEKAREAQRVATLARLRAALVDGPTLTLPATGRLMYSFDPNGSVPIPDVGTAFDGSRISDDWGVLTVESGGVLLRRTDGSVTAIAVPVASDAKPPLTGSGWRLELNAGWTAQRGARPGDWVVTRTP